MDNKKEGLKKKIVNEMTEYFINVAYLTLVFAAFTQYQRFLLAAHDIDYTNYGVAVIKALILAKVIMLGSVFKLGRNIDHKPLIYPTLYKTFLFSILIGLFSIIEHLIKELWQGKGVIESLIEFFQQSTYELAANSLVIFVALIPFFALKELERVFGQEKIRSLFFRNRAQ